MIQYKPRYGFTVWIGATVVAFILVSSGHIHPDTGGVISLTGFLIAFAWAQGGIQLRPGEWQTPGESHDTPNNQSESPTEETTNS